MSLIGVFGAVVTAVTLVSPFHKPIKLLCQPLLWRLIPRQLQPVEWAQWFQHPLLEWVVILSALTVTVEFYVAGLAIMVWSGLQHQVTVLLGVLGLVGHVVFRIKDLLEAPRPADCCFDAPQKLNITVKDYSGDIEDGIPSAHCCGSVMLLYYAIYAAADHLPADALPYVQLGAATWVLWIAYGRLYLGVHSPIDLVMGALLGWSLLALWQHIEEQYITWLLTSQHLHWQALLASFALLRSYPMPSRYTDTINYSIAWLGGWAGVVLGYRHIHPAVGAEHAAEAKALFKWSSAALTQMSSHCHGTNSSSLGSAFRPGFSHQQVLLAGVVPVLLVKVLLGLMLTVLTKIVAKKVLLLLLQHVFRLVPLCIRCMWQPPVVGSSSSEGVKGTAETCRTAFKHQTEQSGVAGRPCSAGMTVYLNMFDLSSFCTLRHAPSGMPYDVIITAKFCSYVAVGYVIFTMDVWWHPLISRMAYASSTA